MFERVEQASSSYLTQADVDVFIAVFKASKSLHETNRAKWDAIDSAPVAEKEQKISEAANLKPGESFFGSAIRVMTAIQASDPQAVAQAKQQYDEIKKQVAGAEQQLASLPPEQAAMMKKQMRVALEMSRQVAEYPSENLKVYTENKPIIDQAAAFFESP